jgi:hypothetical protein
MMGTFPYTTAPPIHRALNAGNETVTSQEQNRSAYMCIYEKVPSPAAQASTDPASDLSKLATAVASTAAGFTVPAEAAAAVSAAVSAPVTPVPTPATVAASAAPEGVEGAALAGAGAGAGEDASPAKPYVPCASWTVCMHDLALAHACCKQWLLIPSPPPLLPPLFSQVGWWAVPVVDHGVEGEPWQAA